MSGDTRTGHSLLYPKAANAPLPRCKAFRCIVEELKTLQARDKSCLCKVLQVLIRVFRSSGTKALLELYRDWSGVRRGQNPLNRAGQYRLFHVKG